MVNGESFPEFLDFLEFQKKLGERY
jgi:hypothetical protein